MKKIETLRQQIAEHNRIMNECKNCQTTDGNEERVYVCNRHHVESQMYYFHSGRLQSLIEAKEAIHKILDDSGLLTIEKMQFEESILMELEL